MTELTEIKTHERSQSGLLITCLCLGEEKIQKQKTVTSHRRTRPGASFVKMLSDLYLNFV